jgi:hypothetical protein
MKDFIFHCTLGGPFDDLFFTRSQPAGLSVEASSPLSPRQRFKAISNFLNHNPMA